MYNEDEVFIFIVKLCIVEATYLTSGLNLIVGLMVGTRSWVETRLGDLQEPPGEMSRRHIAILSG